MNISVLFAQKLLESNNPANYVDDKVSCLYLSGKEAKDFLLSASVALGHIGIQYYDTSYEKIESLPYGVKITLSAYNWEFLQVEVFPVHKSKSKTTSQSTPDYKGENEVARIIYEIRPEKTEVQKLESGDFFLYDITENRQGLYVLADIREDVIGAVLVDDAVKCSRNDVMNRGYILIDKDTLVAPVTVDIIVKKYRKTENRRR